MRVYPNPVVKDEVDGEQNWQARDLMRSAAGSDSPRTPPAVVRTRFKKRVSKLAQPYFKARDGICNRCQFVERCIPTRGTHAQMQGYRVYGRRLACNDGREF